jgi:hypothetical protein
LHVQLKVKQVAQLEFQGVQISLAQPASHCVVHVSAIEVVEDLRPNQHTNKDKPMHIVPADGKVRMLLQDPLTVHQRHDETLFAAQTAVHDVIQEGMNSLTWCDQRTIECRGLDAPCLLASSYKMLEDRLQRVCMEGGGDDQCVFCVCYITHIPSSRRERGAASACEKSGKRW